jgi:hypothetical protein
MIRGFEFGEFGPNLSVDLENGGIRKWQSITGERLHTFLKEGGTATPLGTEKQRPEVA